MGSSSIVHPGMLGVAAAAALAPTGVSASPIAQSTAMMTLITRSKYGVGINGVKPADIDGVVRHSGSVGLPDFQARSSCTP